MSSGFNLPFTVRSTVAYETGLEHIIFMLSTPIDDVTSYFTFVIWRNDDFSVSAEEVIQFDRAIGAEDKRMLERIPGVLPDREHRHGVGPRRQGLRSSGAAGSAPCSRADACASLSAMQTPVPERAAGGDFRALAGR